MRKVTVVLIIWVLFDELEIRAPYLDAGDLHNACHRYPWFHR